jgi:uncharacterized protein (DUF924 family)
VTAPDTVLSFWFDETAPKQWWVRSEAFDREVAARFGELHAAAVRCELWAWRDTPQGRLAEILVLDQLSRNLYRDRPEAFAADPLALALAQEAVAAGADRAVDLMRRPFFYMPFVHSESALIHAVAVRLFEAAGLEDFLHSALRHKAIIDRFGRYPHRNAVLDRESTPEEVAFLATPGSAF